MSKLWNKIRATPYSKLSINPLRKLKFEQKIVPNPAKKVITLQIGDPSVYGNFPPPKQAVDAFEKSVRLDTYLYNVGQGKLEAREAVAQYSKHLGNVTADDIILTSGCGHGKFKSKSFMCKFQFVFFQHLKCVFYRW
jgi:tyrosine aminotransferase